MKAVVAFVDPHAFGLSAKTDADSAHAIWRAAELPPLRQATAKQIGAGLHYVFAAAAGSLYAAVSPRFPFCRLGRGTVFGAALWLAGDELAVTLSGLENPRRTPFKSHLSALAAHALYGSVVEGLLSWKPAKKEYSITVK